MKMSSDRPRRTLRQSTKLIPTTIAATAPSPYSKRISNTGSVKKAANAAPPPPPPEPETPKTGRKTPGRKPGTGARRGRKPAPAKRPECFNNKPTKYHNDYHYGSDFDEDSEEEPDHQDSDDEEESLQAESEANESFMDETLGSLNPEDIEDINSLSNLPIWLNNEIQVEQLIIPGSSEDLVLNDKNLIFPLVGIYESVIKFYKSLRITPFKFEDFCACLSSPESSVLLVELHVQLLKSILREDEAMNVTYGPLEYKDSIQSAFYFIDHITWVDGLLTYFKTDKTLLKYTELIKGNNYPFCSIDIRVKILNVLLNIYLSTNAARETLMFDDISHEDHCRICGRLGELICCETCTSVAHLGCINPPIIDPPDEWKCATCTKHLIPGLSDCIREEDKTSLRHEKLGFDRHGRSYWFLVRRILVESEDGKTAWYYSTPNQLIELLDSFSATYESGLIENINYHKDEILSQMSITEKLTNQTNTQHRKSYLDYENGQLAQLQKSRELIEKQTELEELRVEEEIFLKKQMEEAEKLRLEEEEKLKGELEKKRIREERLERRNKRKYGDDFEDFDDFHDMDFEISQNENADSSTEEKVKADDDKEKLNSTENMDEEKNKDLSHKEENLTENDKKEESETSKPEDDSTEKTTPPENSVEKNETPMEMDLSDNIVEVEVKSEEVNDSPSSKSPNKIVENSLTPPVEKVESPLRPIMSQIEKQIEVLKAELMDNDKERMTRLKSIGLYKLGQENNYKSYVNYYSTDSTALSKLQHNEERDKKRYVSHKFSLTQLSEFKWIGKQLEQYITIQNLCSTIKATLLAFENNIPVTLMHTNWSILRKAWIQTVNGCKSLNDFKWVISMFRGCLRDCLFNNIWVEGVGHLKLVKMNPLERDEMKKTEKRLKKVKDDEDDRFKVTLPFVKYTIPCKHQLWKQKGEEYRLHGQFGWIWMRNSRSEKSSNYKFNLVNGPYKYVIQVKSDNNKIKTMLIDPTVYNKLMAKRNLNMGSKPSTSDVKPEVKVESDATSSEVKVEKTEEAAAGTTPMDTSAETIKTESPPTETTVATTQESDSEVVNSVMQNILSQVDAEVEEKSKKEKTPPPIPQPQPTKKYNTELINVSLGIVSANRILYPKIAHRINILDDLLTQRLKLMQMEEAQLLQKFSSEYPFVKNMNNYKCYSYDCGNGKTCYSPICQLTKMDKTETSSKVSLRKLKPDNTKKNIVYPLTSPYVMNKKPNIFVLQNKELMKLARTGGREITPTGFSSNNKTNTLWNYPCGKPSFYKIWEFNLLNSFNLGSIGMAIRILYSCIRWDDLQMKLPNSAEGGKNQVTTDMEHITSEILQHRILGPFLNKVQYLKRKEIVPIDLPKTVREITPSRLGLRKRKRTELQDKTDPTVVEEWVNENQVEIWEIRYYGDKIERPKLEAMKKMDSPNTRIRSGVILKQPDKFTHQTEPSVERVKTIKQTDVNANANNNNNNTTIVEPIEPVQRTVHLSKRDNHVKINTVNKVQIPTASQQLQQQRVVEQQEKSTVGGGVVAKIVQQGIHTLPTTNLIPARQQPIQRQVVTVQQQQQQPLQQIIAQQQPQSIAAVALQQIQEKQQQIQSKTSPNKKFFVSKAKDGTPKTPVNRKPKVQVQVQQQSPVVTTTQQEQQLQVVNQSPVTQSANDQRLQIVRGMDGKLQLRGLLPGQHAYQTADGKIHVITSTISSGGLVKVDQSQQQQPLQQQGVAGNQQILAAPQTNQQQQQIVLTTTTPGGNKQQIVVTAGTPAHPQQVLMATTPGNKQPQQIVMSTTPGKPQLVMTGGKPQILMATTPGGNKQQYIMTSTPGNPPQFVMATTPGNKQQIMLSTTPLNKQQGVIGTQVVTPPQQPLINISSSTMKTVIGNSSFQQNQLLQQQQHANSRIQSPNIIKSKQTPPLLANRFQGSPIQLQGSQIFLNQTPIILGNQQPQQQPPLIATNSNQGNKILYSDGTKTYMINAGGMNDLQIKALANQFQQKKFIIKTNQEQNVQTTTTTAGGQFFPGNVQQINTSAGTQQIMTTPSGQLIMMTTAPKVTGTPQQQQQQQQVVTSSPVRIAQQPIAGIASQGQQQVVMVSGSQAQPGVTTTPVKFTAQQIITSVGGQPTVVVSGGQQPTFVQQIVTTPGRLRPQIITTPGTMGRQIISGDQMGVRMAVAGQQVLRPNFLGPGQQLVRGQSPTTTQIITSTPTPSGGQIFTTTTAMKPSTLPISIVSPSKSKFHTSRPFSATTQIGQNPPYVTMTMAHRPTTPSKTPVVSPTRAPPTPRPPTTTSMTPNVTMIPTVAMTPAERPGPGVMTSRPLLTMASPKANIMKPTTPTSGNMMYQKLVPVSASQISATSNQQMTPQSQLTQSPGNNQQLTTTVNANNLNSTLSVQAQVIETPEGSKLIIQGANKFTPEELLRIQTHLKKQFLMDTEKSNLPVSVSIPVPMVQQAQPHAPSTPTPLRPITPASHANDSSLSSHIDESINLVIQNTHIQNQNKSPKKEKKVKNIIKDKLIETTPTPSTIMGNSTPIQPEPIEPNNKTNKKLLKLQQTNQKTKLLAILTKYKDMLKKDIEKKRNTMENELKVAIQKEITQDKINAQNAAAAAIQAQSQSSSRGVKRKSTSHASAKPKKKKSKKTSDFDVTKKYCICHTPYDETKFYVGCEKCSNWFHGDCIGITQSMADCLSDYICDVCQTTPAEKTYCLCKQPYDESQFYICCDKCQDWFHGRCIGIIQSESNKMDEYVCPNCDPTTELNSANLKILNPDDFSLMQKLTKQLMLHKSSWAFVKPVDIKDAPNYYKVIKEPMDLQTVDLRVSEKVYSRLRDFIGDVTKIFDNCRYYNAENSEFYKLANGLELFFKEKVILLRKKLI